MALPHHPAALRGPGRASSSPSNPAGASGHHETHAHMHFDGERPRAGDTHQGLQSRSFHQSNGGDRPRTRNLLVSHHAPWPTHSTGGARKYPPSTCPWLPHTHSCLARPLHMQVTRTALDRWGTEAAQPGCQDRLLKPRGNCMFHLRPPERSIATTSLLQMQGKKISIVYCSRDF